MIDKKPVGKSADKTRRRIVKLLKRDGPQDAGTLAAQLGVTAMAIRQHLYALEEAGDICFCSVARPKGRPAKLWQLTEEANRHFPNGHADFSTGLISSIQQVFGAKGMDKLLEVRLDRQVKDYTREIPPECNLADKLDRLADIRTREGYMADILPAPAGDGFLFVENNCPVCEAAKACSGICARELDLFQVILGNEVRIERTEHIVQGARRCAYKVSPVS